MIAVKSHAAAQFADERRTHQRPRSCDFANVGARKNSTSDPNSSGQMPRLKWGRTRPVARSNGIKK